MTETKNGRNGVEATVATERDESADPDEESVANHLDDVKDGAGCTEIWEHLSDQRDTKANAD